MESSQYVAMGPQIQLLVLYVSLHAGTYTVSTCSTTPHLCVLHLYNGRHSPMSVHYRVHTSPLLDHILIRVNLTHILTP
jgi:hypothetical protein